MDEPHLRDRDADDALPAYEFTPFATRSIRHDGWTAQRERQFVEAPPAMGTATGAARPRDSVTLV